MITEELILKDRLFKFLYKRLEKNSFFQRELYERIVQYFENYLIFQKISNAEVQSIYNDFIQSFNEDLKNFQKTGEFPLEINPIERKVSRNAYDVILLMSVLLTPHRFRIMSLIDQISDTFENTLFIGCGPGLEMELVKKKMQKGIAYDLSISSFVKDRHASFDLRETLFTGQLSEKVDAIFLIEILEHLDDPYTLLFDSQKVLKKGGKIYLTTATNIPQFDHRYNFESNHEDFEVNLKKMGLQIIYKEDIAHNYLTIKIDSKNRFYELTKI